MVAAPETQTANAERRLRELGLQLPPAPRPFGAYVLAVQTGRLVFLTGMLPTTGREPAFVGRLGKEFDTDAGRRAANLAALNALAVAREQLGSLDRVTRVVQMTVFIATSGDAVDQPRVADGASELLRDVFGPARMSARVVVGAASLPLGVPIELAVVLEVEP
jgi:enamine deaminase RidA (YjgF/YER057c/UK114 family)